MGVVNVHLRGESPAFRGRKLCFAARTQLDWTKKGASRCRRTSSARSTKTMAPSSTSPAARALLPKLSHAGVGGDRAQAGGRTGLASGQEEVLEVHQLLRPGGGDGRARPFAAPGHTTRYGQSQRRGCGDG